MWQQTADGSWSWYDDTVGELQHNRAGAYSEALTQYVQPLLAQHPPHKSDWRILDSCFGLGYNTWTLLQQIINKRNKPQSLTVWAVEIDPRQLIRSLAIIDQPMFRDLKSIYDASAHKI